MELTLNDISVFIIDCEHKTAPIQDTGYPSIRTPNVGRGNLILEGVNRVSEEVYKEWTKRGEPLEGDLIIAREAPVGNVAIIPNNLKVCLGQRTVLVRPNKDLVDPEYLCYLLLSDKLQSQILTKTTGATVAHLNMKDIRELKIPKLPSLTHQKCLAKVIARYYNLIENNNQRIKLLEEMAEEIYKEWFVRFRFPGYEKANFIDGLPEGWEYKRVDEFNSFKMSESKLKKFNGTKTYLATADISGIDISSAGEQIDWENKPSRAQLIPELNSVFFARMSNTYKVLVFADANKELIDELALTSGFLGLKAINENALPFLFWFIKSTHFHNYKDVYANGATQVSLTNEGFHMIKLVEPTLEVIEDYGKITTSFLNEILILNKKNQVLQQTRDLLLPRLISGKLSIEHLVEETIIAEN